MDIEDIQNLKNVYILSGGIKSELTKYIKTGDYYRANMVVKEFKNKFNNIYGTINTKKSYCILFAIAQFLVYFTYFTCLPFLNVASSTTFPLSS